MQNKVIKGKNNPVVMTFGFEGEFFSEGLENFTNIEFKLGTETYTTEANTVELFLTSKTELRLNIGMVTTLDAGSYEPDIIGYSPTYPDGYCMGSAGLGRIYVLDEC